MASISSTQSNVIDLSPAEWVQSSKPLRLLDVRSRFEYTLFHAPNAINLSLPRILMAPVPLLRNWALPKWFWDLSKDEPIAIICLTAHRSPIAAQILANVGFTQVFNVTGGMMAWRKAGLPVCKGHSA
ncbi:Thiosulfate sulfurtransferase GlpE [Halomicronema hongdechloris C2206]|uniref:Thiosulfate sulfurtransferase GlpE n=1 Tax=Halomicronema hongdechloris C2206 TaxID=1641165 RepID=A0A1Z3HSY1_9CYAN|nr:rhodanese-like domain-containing protein [Halomicronema hongdechloris]ASC73395.1 Thiosulfate sulfurtransferase GlpE [Halomicronema hongdechloris C2206]